MKHKRINIKEKISIKWKIFLYLLGFTAILLIILWLFQICYLNTFYKMIKTRDAENVQEKMIALIKSDKTADEVSDLIDEMAAENNFAIYVTDTDGNEIYNAEYIANSRMSSITQEQFEVFYNAARSAGGSTKIEYEGSQNKTFESLFPKEDIPEPGNGAGAPGNEPIPDAAHQEGFVQNHGLAMMESAIYVNIVESEKQSYVVMLNSLLSPIDSTVKTLKVQLLWISGIMMILSLGIALLLSRKISRSMIKVNASAKELAGGNFKVEFDGRDYREITELSNTLNHTAHELEKTESFRRELIANVSHDLRTPLTMIIAYSEVMRDLPGENTPENIQVVIDESKRLANLVNDMLDISKLQAGVMDKKLTVFNLTESIHSVFERYNKLKEQDGYIINFIFDGDVFVRADEFKIYQVIYNLVNNAINYTGKDKTVTVSQIVKENTVRIEIKDSGEGIEKDALPYVWDRYYKVDKTHKRAVTGTGLGLSIVKNILTLHHAEFGVESEVGCGSIFWFELALEKDYAPP